MARGDSHHDNPQTDVTSGAELEAKSEAIGEAGTAMREERGCTYRFKGVEDKVWFRGGPMKI